MAADIRSYRDRMIEWVDRYNGSIDPWVATAEERQRQKGGVAAAAAAAAAPAEEAAAESTAEAASASAAKVLNLPDDASFASAARQVVPPPFSSFPPSSSPCLSARRPAEAPLGALLPLRLRPSSFSSLEGGGQQHPHQAPRSEIHSYLEARRA
eukprot:CAMPEP_0194783328 /NCGR_PEP_ID=MMETSP0323_2-20130528/79158_1 /TAXON_ID=2866 ORGANISM="Crypthecodinium cohnii, Strain Seligo" /NCGR_SAMPLE_ID=MMETSP0323_2 /ASSEMBLY_ACC=CAM_ASM_000346 /LENGTH=153 /DNA_ID=CAMNT_0039722197 /DNA_START=247 /DNA_END=706 /DNA_ORIENTATION=+